MQVQEVFCSGRAMVPLKTGHPHLAAQEPAPSAPTPDVDVLTEERLDDPWKVILFNDDIHTFDEVILQLVKATGCSLQHAERVAWKVHTEGKAVAYQGTFDECFRVNGVLREIQLITEIEG